MVDAPWLYTETVGGRDSTWMTVRRGLSRVFFSPSYWRPCGAALHSNALPPTRKEQNRRGMYLYLGTARCLQT